MDRKERRRKARERKKLEGKLRKEAPRLETERRVSSTRLSRVLRTLTHAVTSTKVLWGLFGILVTLLGFWKVVRPHVSIEPYISLNPVDPYSVQFTVKNESGLFEVHDINCVCWPRSMQSGNGFSVVSFTPLPNMHHQIRILAPGASSTVDCPAAIGGLGTYSGQVLYAELEIEVSYSQSWWPFGRNERYPFVSMRDVQGAVHWMHITPEQERPILPTKK
jgi:hypothetical protein